MSKSSLKTLKKLYYRHWLKISIVILSLYAAQGNLSCTQPTKWFRFYYLFLIGDFKCVGSNGYSRNTKENQDIRTNLQWFCICFSPLKSLNNLRTSIQYYLAASACMFALSCKNILEWTLKLNGMSNGLLSMFRMPMRHVLPKKTDMPRISYKGYLMIVTLVHLFIRQSTDINNQFSLFILLVI